jgi:hypothetical protein
VASTTLQTCGTRVWYIRLYDVGFAVAAPTHLSHIQEANLLTVYGKQCTCGSRMREVHGGYECIDDDCEAFEVYDWDSNNWMLVVNGCLIIAAIVLFMIVK